MPSSSRRRCGRFWSRTACRATARRSRRAGCGSIRRPASRKGGRTARSSSRGDPDKSLLIQAIRYDGDIKMPQKGKLPDAEIAMLTAWVKGGAPVARRRRPRREGRARPSTCTPGRRRTGRSSRSSRPAVPEIRNPKSAIRNPIDAFLLAKLRGAGLTFAPPADKRTLLRRVTST